MDISYESLKDYPEHGTPVVIAYREMNSNKEPETTSAYDCELEDGTDSGPCPFVVNGVIGENLEIHNPKLLVARAVKHLKEDKGGVLAISHAETPQSTYNNPELYPMMFPHLFPYGIGGIGSTDKKSFNISEIAHKRYLLMYHDKRFQLDPFFPLVAFNHEQIKKGTTGGYLLTDRRNFRDIADRLMNINTNVLSEISTKLSSGDKV